MDLIKFFFYTIPEMFLIMAFVLTLSGFSLKEKRTNYFITSLLLACFVGILNHSQFDDSIRLSLQFLITLSVIKFVFNIPILRIFISMIVTLVTLQIMEFITYTTISTITGNNIEQMKHLPLLILIGGWIDLIILSAIYYVVRRKEFSIFKKNLSEGAPATISVYTYIILTFMYLLTIVLEFLFTNGKELFNTGLLTLIFFQILLILLIKEMIHANQRETELQIYKEYIENVNSLFTTIRAQRHDFSNHIQVLYIFAKQKDHGKMIQYLEELTGEIKSINEVLLSDNPGLSALLQTKLAQFQQEGIQLELKLHSSLTETGIKIIELNQIIGNLLDNAADAIRNSGYPCNGIKLSTQRIDGKVRIQVQNDRPLIPPNLQRKIFEYGFSTKENHTGIGLAIVSDLVKKNKGTLQLESNETKGTLFTIEFPSKKKFK